MKGLYSIIGVLLIITGCKKEPQAGVYVTAHPDSIAGAYYCQVIQTRLVQINDTLWVPEDTLFTEALGVSYDIRDSTKLYITGFPVVFYTKADKTFLGDHLYGKFVADSIYLYSKPGPGPSSSGYRGRKIY